MSATGKPVATSAPPAAWHALPVDAALEALVATPRGLTAEDAAGARSLRHGRNELPPPARRSVLLRFALQFHNLLIYVLLAAGRR